MEIFRTSGRTGKTVSTAAQVRQAFNLWLSSPSPHSQPAHRWEGPCTWARPSNQSLVFLVMTQFSLSFWSFLVNLKLFLDTVHWRYNKAIVASKSGCICCLFFHQRSGSGAWSLNMYRRVHLWRPSYCLPTVISVARRSWCFGALVGQWAWLPLKLREAWINNFRRKISSRFF